MPLGRAGVRSVRRDVEAQFFVVTRNAALRSALAHEYSELTRHSEAVRAISERLLPQRRLCSNSEPQVALPPRLRRSRWKTSGDRNGGLG